VFENRVLRKIVGLVRDMVTRELRRLRNNDLYDLYSTPSVTQLIKLRRMVLAVHVARMGRTGEGHARFL
jgi:hypothetical protein